VRQEFPAEWAKFQNQKPADGHRFELVLKLLPEHYPFWSQNCLNNVERVDILARSTKNDPVDVFENKDVNDNNTRGTLNKDAALGDLLRGTIAPLPEQTPTDKITLFFEDAKILTDLWIAVTWSDKT